MLELIMAAQTVILLCMAARIAFDAVREHRRKAGGTDALRGHAGRPLARFLLHVPRAVLTTPTPRHYTYPDYTQQQHEVPHER